MEKKEIVIDFYSFFGIQIWKRIRYSEFQISIPHYQTNITNPGFYLIVNNQMDSMRNWGREDYANEIMSEIFTLTFFHLMVQQKINLTFFSDKKNYFKKVSIGSITDFNVELTGDTFHEDLLSRLILETISKKLINKKTCFGFSQIIHHVIDHFLGIKVEYKKPSYEFYRKFMEVYSKQIKWFDGRITEGVFGFKNKEEKIIDSSNIKRLQGEYHSLNNLLLKEKKNSVYLNLFCQRLRYKVELNLSSRIETD